MIDHQYVAWFRNLSLASTEQCHDWVACFLVAASDKNEALHWADELCRDFAIRNDQVFLRSYLDAGRWEVGSVPRVVAGTSVSDEAIGW